MPSLQTHMEVLVFQIYTLWSNFCAFHFSSKLYDWNPFFFLSVSKQQENTEFSLKSDIVILDFDMIFIICIKDHTRKHIYTSFGQNISNHILFFVDVIKLDGLEEAYQDPCVIHPVG